MKPLNRTAIASALIVAVLSIAALAAGFALHGQFSLGALAQSAFFATADWIESSATALYQAILTL